MSGFVTRRLDKLGIPSAEGFPIDDTFGRLSLMNRVPGLAAAKALRGHLSDANRQNAAMGSNE